MERTSFLASAGEQLSKFLDANLDRIKQVDRYEKDFGMRFLGWYNVAYGWDFDNVILLELPDYSTIDKLEGDPRSRAIGHRAGEWMFERHHAMFLRERMGPELEFIP